MNLWNAVIFDIDDTLYDQMDPFRAACDAVLGARCPDRTALYQARNRRGMEALTKYNAGEFTLEENHIYRMKAACADLGEVITAREAMLLQQVYAEEQSCIHVTEGMERVLNFCCQQGWKLGVLTNGPSDHQRNKFEILGLDRWIPREHVVVSGDCGYMKPAREIFTYAEGKLQLTPGTTLFVGDSFDHDMVGAAACGWQTFWLNRRSLPLPTYPAVTAHGSEDALLAHLKRGADL